MKIKDKIFVLIFSTTLADAIVFATTDKHLFGAPMPWSLILIITAVFLFSLT